MEPEFPFHPFLFSESPVHIPGLHPICGVMIMQENIIFLTFMSGKYSQT